MQIEQASLAYLLSVDQNLWSNIKIVHQRILNSNFYFTPSRECCYQDGDFIVHFFGRCDKPMLMKEWSSKIS